VVHNLALLVLGPVLAAFPAVVDGHPVPVTAASVPAGSTRPVSWLAAGDSYSSGEGIEGTGLAPDDRCAQSDKAFGPRAASILSSQRGWRIAPLTFVACTGAITGDYFNHRNQDHPDQDTWARTLHPRTTRYDVITASFGGNDVDFAGIMKDCVRLPSSFMGFVGADQSWKDGCTVSDQDLRSRIDKLVAGTSSSPRVDPGRSGPTPVPFGPDGKDESLAAFYADLANSRLAPGGVLVVAGYPRIFAPSEQWGRWRDGRCGEITADDADLLGRAGAYLDTQLAGVVNAARQQLTGERKIRYVSRLALFDNGGRSHSLCAPDTEWMNGTWAFLQDSSLRVEHDFHPNRIGHQVTAEHVAATVAKYLSPTPEPSAPASSDSTDHPTPEPTPVPTAGATQGDDGSIGDGTSHFGIGDDFDLICYVAWPTAPTYTSNSIEMTMACPNMPKQYLFAHVSYPDPDLPMTPSTGNVRVVGTIVNIATSAYGYKELVVDAREIGFNP
jgi:hypothetical protein